MMLRAISIPTAALLIALITGGAAAQETSRGEELVFELIPLEKDLTELQISPSGRLIVGVENGGGLVTWRWQDGKWAPKKIGEIPRYAGMLSIAPGDAQALFVTFDGLCLYNLDPFELVWKSFAGVRSIAYSPDGQHVYVTLDVFLQCLRRENGQQVWQIKAPGPYPTMLSWANPGRTFLFLATDPAGGGLKVYSLDVTRQTTREHIDLRGIGAREFNGQTLSQNARWLAGYAPGDKLVEVWNTAAKQKVAEIKNDVVGGGVWPMATSDGRFVVMSVLDASDPNDRPPLKSIVALYELKDGKPVYRGRVSPADCRVGKVRLAEGVQKIALYAACRPQGGGLPQSGLFLVDLPK
jgi:hypothetical protein